MKINEITIRVNFDFPEKEFSEAIKGIGELYDLIFIIKDRDIRKRHIDGLQKISSLLEKIEINCRS